MKYLLKKTVFPTLLFTLAPTIAAASYPLSDTMQNVCYDNETDIACPVTGEAFAGQDAQFTGTPQSFTDNGDGTVSDNVTGLIWQQVPDAERLGWQAAQDYCETLELADRDDWRTPNLKELFGISSFGAGWPYLDTSVFTLLGAEKDQQFWSSNFYLVGTTHDGAPSAFGVNHVTGHIKAYPAESIQRGKPDNSNRPPPPPKDEAAQGAKTQPEGRMPPNFGKLVRCVSGDETGLNEFADGNDGTVLDAATGLMWGQADAGALMNWEDALAFAARMNAEDYLGHDDWRLPDIRELQSIVDYSGVFPAINSDVFEITEPDTYFWSSTSAYFNDKQPDHVYAWYVAFGYAPGPDGEDVHGAGAVRFIGKSESSPNAEGDYRPLNAVRLVRDAD